jgi:hypothetical protein
LVLIVLIFHGDWRASDRKLVTTVVARRDQSRIEVAVIFRGRHPCGHAFVIAGIVRLSNDNVALAGISVDLDSRRFRVRKLSLNRGRIEITATFRQDDRVTGD